jgi:DNA invertase Pin-like site-specific DNA recombinase
VSARRKPVAAPSLPARALALVRISDDRDGSAAGVGRQEEDCRALADRLGWSIAEVVVENDTSAYKRRDAGVDADGLSVRRTRRPEYRRVLRALSSGTADGLVVYDLDRVARQPRDLEDLIDLVDQRRVPVVSVTGSLDLSTDAGVTMARIMVAIANKSSADTSRRVARAHVQQAAEGRPPGGWRAYGYEADRRTIVPAEADVIRDVAGRIIAGDSLRSIRRDLDAAGIKPPHAAAWSMASIRSTVTKPMVAGLRSLHGEIVAVGDWPPILDRQTWELVRAVLAQETRKTGTRAVDRHLLSGIARCGLCSAKMYVGTNGRSGQRVPVYKCSGCARLSRNQAWLDAYVTEAVLELLTQAPVVEARSRQAKAKPGRDLAQLTTLRARRKQLLQAFAVEASPDVDAGDLREMLATIDGRIAELEAAVLEAAPGPRLPNAAEFGDLPLDRQRAVVRRLLAITVHPATRAGTANDPASIVLAPAYV